MSAAFHLEVDRSDHQTNRLTSRPRNPLPGSAALVFAPPKYVGNPIHEIEVRER
ncbi:hypothetical protein GA0070563_101678 [Micromonospora carbonacea]|jgi:hypothetical protein|uniref:Uncharacterized protein n=1 Tax=Micromonospora carbonacea TaxID=47853 RepID=A0A1C4UQA9_9ACTN|nr:hypothetical protein GA0070563_101678 [Micromonospora carbonacea]